MAVSSPSGESRWQAVFICAIVLFAFYALFYRPSMPQASGVAINRAALRLASKGPVVIEIGTTYCGACRTMDPILVELQRKYAGKVAFRVYNLDALDHRVPEASYVEALASAVGVVATPTFLVANAQGGIAQMWIGAARSHVFDQALAPLLKP